MFSFIDLFILFAVSVPSCYQLLLRMRKRNARSRNRQWLPCPRRKKDRLLSPTHISLQRVVSHRFISQPVTRLPADPRRSGRWKRTMTMTRMTPVRIHKLKLTLSKYKSSSLIDKLMFYRRSHANCCVFLCVYSHSGMSGVQPPLRAGEPCPTLLYCQS